MVATKRKNRTRLTKNIIIDILGMYRNKPIWSFIMNVINEHSHYLYPAIFNDVKKPGSSETYRVFNTTEIIDTLEKQGFVPTHISQSRARNEEMLPYKKHMVRFRHVDSKPVLNQIHQEIVLVNSHEGTSSFKMMLGFFRLVCSNGLIVSSGVNTEYRFRHHEKYLDTVAESAIKIVDEYEYTLERAEKMSKVILSAADRIEFASRAASIKYGDEEAPFDTNLIITPRRSEDNKTDLWSVFNIAQENLIKGGISNPQHRQGMRRFSTRGIRNVDKVVSTNQKLWELADEYLTQA